MPDIMEWFTQSLRPFMGVVESVLHDSASDVHEDRLAFEGVVVSLLEDTPSYASVASLREPGHMTWGKRSTIKAPCPKSAGIHGKVSAKDRK